MMQLTNKLTSEIQTSYKLESTVLENVESIKFKTKDLKWSTHISKVCTKANMAFLKTKSIFLPSRFERSCLHV